MHTTQRNTRKVALTVLALGAASAAVVFGSLAAWTAQTTNPGNEVTAGTLTMSNDKDATFVFDTSGIKPGENNVSTPDQVTLVNTGSTNMNVELTQDNVTGSAEMKTAMGLKVYDSTSDYCVYPDADPGPCLTYGAWDGTTAMNGIAVPGDATAHWPPAESHTFDLIWEFGGAAGDNTQGDSAGFDLTWDGA